MNQTSLLYIWFGTTAGVIIAALISKKIRGRRSSSLQDFVAAAYSSGGAIVLLRVLSNLFTNQQLQTELEWDGSITLCIGSVIGIFLSLRELRKLF